MLVGGVMGGRGGWEGGGGGDGVDGIGARFGEGPRPRFLLGWPGIRDWVSHRC